jgi:hypothetical protein
MFYDIQDYKVMSNTALFECDKCKKVKNNTSIFIKKQTDTICIDCLDIFAPNVESIKVLKYINSYNEFKKPTYIVSLNSNDRTMHRYELKRATLIFAHKLGRVQCPVALKCWDCLKSGNKIYCASFLKIIREFTQLLVKKYTILRQIFICDIAIYIIGTLI